MYNLSNVMMEMYKYGVPETFGTLVDSLNCLPFEKTVQHTKLGDDGLTIRVEVQPKDAAHAIEMIKTTVANYIRGEKMSSIMSNIFPFYNKYIEEKHMYFNMFKVIPIGTTIVIEI